MKPVLLVTICLLIHSGVSSDQSTELEMKTTLVECNTDLMQTYMLKGRSYSTRDERNILCPAITHNCCIKGDLQRVFHYVKNILPLRINEHKDRIKLAFDRIRHLHKTISRHNNNFLGNEAKLRFCRLRRREFDRFDFDILENKMNDYLEGVYQRTYSHFSRFYCAICDGWMHGYIKQTAGVMRMIVSEGACLGYLDQNMDSIVFWNKNMVEYLKLVQDIVDCTHYTHSYNMTFYDEKVVNHAAEVLKCMDTFGEDRSKVCQPICERMSQANLNPIIDGDSLFLTNTVNFFEKFYKNREVGEFVSIEMRRYYKRFETLKSFTPVQENEFVRMVIDRTFPIRVRIDPLQQLNDGISRGALRTGSAPSMTIQEGSWLGARGLEQVDKETPKLEDKGSEVVTTVQSESPVSDEVNTAALGLGANELSLEEAQLVPSLDVADLRPGRLLQGVTPPAKEILQIRTPKAETSTHLAQTYEQISVKRISQEESADEFVIRPFRNLINLDILPKISISGDGFMLDKYQTTLFNLTETEFNKKLFEYRPADKYNTKIEALIGDFNVAFDTSFKKCLNTSYRITIGNLQDDVPPKRKLTLAMRKEIKLSHRVNNEGGK